jgi:hypothetical protein
LGYNALCKTFADTAYQPRAQVAADAGNGGGQCLLAGFDLKLETMFGMINPMSAQAQKFSRADFSYVSNNGYQTLPIHAGWFSSLGS